MNRQKHALQTPAETPSDGQARFIRRLRRHRITVRTARILILILFLLLWEFCADQGIIDSFIFSSPSTSPPCCSGAAGASQRSWSPTWSS